ncbi:MAG: hypothetical protein AABW50_05900 [Nanoarchaeota archaeon]
MVFKRIKRFIFKKRSNAVIEGTDHESWSDLQYMALPLKISKDVSLINDGNYRFLFYGKANDFENVDRVDDKSRLEVKIDSLFFPNECIAIDENGKAVYGNNSDSFEIDATAIALERPRSIVLKDGRIFIEEDMLKKDSYLKVVPSIIKMSKKIFDYLQT